MSSGGGTGKRPREIDKSLKKDTMWGAIEKEDQDFLDEILGGPSPESLASSNYQGSHRGTFSHIKKRRRLLPDETACLVAAFEKSQKPGQEVRDQLAAKLRMSPRAIQIWFQNRRAKVKRDEAESGKAMLSFGPASVKPRTPQSAPVQRRIEPAVSQQDMSRFNDIFQMPEVGSTLCGSPIVQAASNHSHKSSLDSAADASTPVTWESPGQWSENWHSLDLIPASSNSSSQKENEDLNWMDDFLNA